MQSFIEALTEIVDHVMEKYSEKKRKAQKRTQEAGAMNSEDITQAVKEGAIEAMNETGSSPEEFLEPAIPRQNSFFGNLFGRKKSNSTGGPKPGDLVKVKFTRAGETERMWVQVTGKRGRKYTGILDNEPVIINKRLGDKVSFTESQIVKS